MTSRYRIEDESGFEIIREYKGNIENVAKKAWRDLKSMRLRITNLDTGEEYCFDYSNWKVAQRWNNKSIRRRN